MRFSFHLLLLAGLLMINLSCTNSPATEAIGETVESSVIPEGSTLSVRLNEAVSTLGNHAEDGFSATLAAPVVVDGKSFLSEGTQVKGVVRESVSASPFLEKQAVLTVSLSEIFSEDERIPIRTTSRTATSGRFGKQIEQQQAEIVIPADTLLTFRLRTPVEIR